MVRGAAAWRGRRARRGVAAGLALGALLVGLAARTASAVEEDKRPLTGRLFCTAPRARTSGPLAVEVELDWRGTGVIEGALRIEISDGAEVRCMYERPDIFLASGKSPPIRLLLPSPGPGDYNSQLKAQMTFYSEKGVFRVPSCQVFVPQMSERGLVVAFSEPRGRPGVEALALHKLLKLERFLPARDAGEGGAPSRGVRRPLVTTPAYLAPDVMPSVPAACCAFDMIVLAGEGFSLMRKKQLEAVLIWVRAGGSVLVLPTGGMKAHHARFLNELAGADADSPDYALTPAGRVEGEAGFGRFHAGLGRAVVGLGVPKDDVTPESPAWRRTAAFLWKVRRAHVSSIARKGVWADVEEEKAPDGSAMYYQDMQYQQQGGGPRFGRVPVSVGSTLSGKLFPERIKVIPLWVIVLILALFVAVIGPVDYFVLGLLKRRKLTWVTFPAAAIGFALFTMLLAEIYMGSSDHRNSVTVVDLGKGGRILRTSRYEVIVAGRNRKSVTEVAGGFFAPVEPSALAGGYDEYGRYGGYGGYSSRAGRSVPIYEGLVPTRFTATQHINQWEPRMNRFLYIGPEAPSPERRGGGRSPRVKLDWDAVGPELWDGPVKRNGLPEARAAVIESDPTRMTEIVAYRGGEVRTDRGSYCGLQAKTLQELCVRPRKGFFTVVSQVSPTGGGDFEDSAVLDPTDPEQWLLAVVVRDGQSFTVYRRLFHKGADAF
jgi:hypothetical protein